MQKEELHKKLDLLLSHPSKNILKDFQKELMKRAQFHIPVVVK